MFVKNQGGVIAASDSRASRKPEDFNDLFDEISGSHKHLKRVEQGLRVVLFHYNLISNLKSEGRLFAVFATTGTLIGHSVG